MLSACPGSKVSSGAVARVAGITREFVKGLSGDKFYRTDDPAAVQKIGNCILELIKRLDEAFRLGTEQVLSPAERIARANSLISSAHEILRLLERPLHELRPLAGPNPIGMIKSLLSLEGPIYNLGSAVERAEERLERFASRN